MHRRNLKIILSVFVSLLVAVAHAQNPTADIPPVPPVLIDIVRCESGYRQYDADGTVLRSKTADYGLAQINANHRAESKALGYDIMTPEGNIGYALYLYQTQGTAPWRSSSGCWKSKSVD